MIDSNTAKHLVEQRISAYDPYREEGIDLAIAVIEERDYGWIFFLQSRQFLETQDDHYYLYGCGPIIVDKEDGSLHRLTVAWKADEATFVKQRKKRKRPADDS